MSDKPAKAPQATATPFERRQLAPEPKKQTYRLTGNNVQTKTCMAATDEDAWERLRLLLPLCNVVMEVLHVIQVPANNGARFLDRLQTFDPSRVGRFARRQEFWIPVLAGFTKDPWTKDDGGDFPKKAVETTHGEVVPTLKYGDQSKLGADEPTELTKEEREDMIRRSESMRS